MRMRCEGMLPPASMPKREDPPIHAIMKAAKMRPKGGGAEELEESAGVQLKTKMYMDPSKREMMPPAMRIELSFFICCSGPETSQLEEATAVEPP
jgi:hypothetical protein